MLSFFLILLLLVPNLTKMLILRNYAIEDKLLSVAIRVELSESYLS